MSDRYLLVKGRAGLGNRMLCALTGILYARLAGRRLLVDWSDPIYAEGGLNVFHRYFRCPRQTPPTAFPRRTRSRRRSGAAASMSRRARWSAPTVRSAGRAGASYRSTSAGFDLEGHPFKAKGHPFKLRCGCPASDGPARLGARLLPCLWFYGSLGMYR